MTSTDEDFKDPLEEKVEHELLGQRVKVILARAGEPETGASTDIFFDCEDLLEEDVVCVGVLDWLDAGGQVKLTQDDGGPMYCWPALEIVPAPKEG